MLLPAILFGLCSVINGASSGICAAGERWFGCVAFAALGIGSMAVSLMMISGGCAA